MQVIKSIYNGFWGWYQRNYPAVLVVTTVIFLMQLAHLYWLFTSVILAKLTGQPAFELPEQLKITYVLADYLEVPTLVSASLIYINELRQRVTFKALLYLVLLNTQWAHILWITDEVLLTTFANYSLIEWNAAVAWVAILIDYLEVPVIIDTLRRVFAERGEIFARLTGRRAYVPEAGVAEDAEPARAPAGARA
jgi:hypothetical protein